MRKDFSISVEYNPEVKGLAQTIGIKDTEFEFRIGKQVVESESKTFVEDFFKFYEEGKILPEEIIGLAIDGLKFAGEIYMYNKAEEDMRTKVGKMPSKPIEAETTFVEDQDKEPEKK